MEGTSYQIYLTKAHDAAKPIAAGLKMATPWTREGGETLSISCGNTDDSGLVPAIYQGLGLFYASIEYRNGEDFRRPLYEVILC